ncbi:hypothetical protein [Xenorhabdus eapokensis]|uniref:Uncharacterized protein n=1 Tax=Xenorhabdus eapokensis TaxID=1873482 RepID=A0A1Q5TMX1_9GAMM|nr:hypothetical protein [Xenorhabdus eapokensis]OKP01565.1 hypothetical protein Xedl_02839 [Xenorhabdus eapokensis]
MSDSYLLFVPKDPCFIPEQSAIDKAEGFLRTIKKSDKKQKTKHCKRYAHLWRQIPPAIEHDIVEELTLFHGMENFTIPSCLHCKSDITKWWDEKMAYLGENLPRTETIYTKWSTPCCGQEVSLLELDYQNWGAFGCFALMIDTTKTDIIHTEGGLSLVIEKIETLLKTPVNIVWQHI